jgi:hypothetical protein
LSIEVIQMPQEIFTAVVHLNFSFTEVLVNEAFALLPFFGPKPCLIGRHGQGRPQLNDAVSAFSYLDLGTGLIEMQALAKRRRQGDHASALYADIPVVAVVVSIRLSSHAPSLPNFNRKTAKRLTIGHRSVCMDSHKNSGPRH